MASFSTFPRIRAVALLAIVFLSLSGCVSTSQSEKNEKEFIENLSRLAKDPGGDVPGKDFKTIPRYPKSVRIAFKKSESKERFTVLTAYRANDDLQAVSSFYESKMAENGWQLQIKEEKILTMVFFREGTGGGLPFVQMMFRPMEDGKTIIDIVVQGRKR